MDAMQKDKDITNDELTNVKILICLCESSDYLSIIFVALETCSKGNGDQF